MRSFGRKVSEIIQIGYFGYSLNLSGSSCDVVRGQRKTETRMTVTTIEEENKRN
jgi:hypothetical protein